MRIRTTQPRRARIALIGLTAAAFAIVALPGVAGAQYPPQPPPQTITIGAVASMCQNQASYVSYKVSTQGFDASQVAGLRATVTIVNSSGKVVSGPTPGQPLVGQVLNTEPTSASTFRVEVAGQSATAPVQPSQDCSTPQAQASPPSATPQAVAAGGGSGSLPQTGGSSPAQILWIALGALVAGGLILAASSRRHSALKSDS